MFLYSDIKNDTEKISNGAILLFFAFFILIAYSIFMYSNKSSWSKEISSNNVFSTNLIFNNGNLQTNSLDIQIKIPNKYYITLVNQLKYYEQKNIYQLCVDGDLLDEYMYVISDKYFYIEIASNLKMYFKNLFIENENAEKKFIGYRIFIIEEKKYANREGSEYILVNAKNKIVNDINYKIMLKKLEAINKKYIKTSKDGIKEINEDNIKNLVAKDKKKFQKLLNKYYIELK
ncbi:hypothetical protein [Arcobacter sp. LA11]|uniref:hypothetical protein n=1 Tax=Arcobacter sp. LA11 TaxID=1898176 RepID=UPI0011601B8D|nr:hypothetical protein [Arcobacter sp. LA11]